MMREKSGNSSSFATARAQKTFEDFKKEWWGWGWGRMENKVLRAKSFWHHTESVFSVALLERDSYFIHKRGRQINNRSNKTSFTNFENRYELKGEK